MDVWNYILGYRNTLKSVFETWVVHIPVNKFFWPPKKYIFCFFLFFIFFLNFDLISGPSTSGHV